MIASAASRVWDEVAYDCLQATAEELNKDINQVTIRRSQVIEIALDAGRTEEKMKRSPLYTDDFERRWEAASYPEKIAIVRPAFGYDRYGV